MRTALNGTVQRWNSRDRPHNADSTDAVIAEFQSLKQLDFPVAATPKAENTAPAEDRPGHDRGRENKQDRRRITFQGASTATGRSPPLHRRKLSLDALLAGKTLDNESQQRDDKGRPVCCRRVQRQEKQSWASPELPGWSTAQDAAARDHPTAWSTKAAASTGESRPVGTIDGRAKSRKGEWS